MDFCISRDVLGSDRDLTVTGDAMSWTNDTANCKWILRRRACQNDDGDLLTLASLCGAKITVTPPVPVMRTMEPFMSGSHPVTNVPWEQALSRDAYKSFVMSIIGSVRHLLREHKGDVEYYERVWVPGNRLIKSLQPAYVDVARLNKLIDGDDGNINVLKTFVPIDETGQCAPVAYARNATKTGRLTITSGPSILTLKRQHRALLRSRWGDQGRIVYVDFSALEVRVILYEAGKRCDENDIYTVLNNDLFSGKLDRDVVKGAVIADLYGQSKDALAKRLNVGHGELEAFIKVVSNYFQTKKLLARVKREFKKNGYITNRYGRRVAVEQPLNHVFINLYAQSTGVDVTMLGFEQVVRSLEGKKVRPIFLLHDALLLDCHQDELSDVLSLHHVIIPGYVQHFVLKPSLLDVHGDDI